MNPSLQLQLCAGTSKAFPQGGARLSKMGMTAKQPIIDLLDQQLQKVDFKTNVMTDIINTEKEANCIALAV